MAGALGSRALSSAQVRLAAQRLRRRAVATAAERVGCRHRRRWAAAAQGALHEVGPKPLGGDPPTPNSQPEPDPTLGGCWVGPSSF